VFSSTHNAENTQFDAVTYYTDQTTTIIAGQGGDNSYEQINFEEYTYGLTTLSKLAITFGGSGAITHLTLAFEGFGEDGEGGVGPGGDDGEGPGSGFPSAPGGLPTLGDDPSPPQLDPQPDPLPLPQTEPVNTFDDDGKCSITSFALWDAENYKEMTNGIYKLYDGAKICKPSVRVNIEAKAKKCVDKVKLSMTGREHISRTERTPPYMLVGDEPGVRLFQMDLPHGEYTLSATPDGNSDLQKEITFEVLNC